VNPYIVLVVQILFSSGTYIIANAATQTIPAANLTFLRTIISGVVYLIYLLYARLPFRYRGRDLKLLLILGFLSVPINQFAFLYGVKYTTATEAAILYSTAPILVLIVASIYLKEKITLPKIAGTLMAFVGVAVIILEKGLTIGISHLKGDLFVFVAVIAWTLYTTLGRKLILRHGAINSAAFSALAGSAMFLPIGIWSSFKFNYSSLSAGQWGEVVYLSLITSIVGYMLWYYALGKVEASRVAVFTNGQPVTTAILAYIFLGQGISLTFAFGAMVTISGVIITQLNLRGRGRDRVQQS
jgi:drug/metabolite transporter (DMT)-like permease